MVHLPRVLLLSVVSVMLSGCGTDFRADPSASGGHAPVGGLVIPGDDNAQPVRTVPPTAPVNTTTAPATATAEAPVATPPATAQVPAQVGVGKKGRGYGGGIVTEPIRAKFRAEQRIVFDQVKHALDLYKATNGRAPKSHDEFMQEVIQANQIQLPDLPSGETYVYDPQAEELMVQK